MHLLRFLVVLCVGFLVGLPHADAQQEGRILLFNANIPLQIDSQSALWLSPITSLNLPVYPHPLGAFNRTVNGFQLDCDGDSISHVFNAFLENSRHPQGVFSGSAYLHDTAGYGAPHVFADFYRPDIMHAVLQPYRVQPHFPFHLPAYLLTYNRHNKTPLSYRRLADSVALGAIHIVRHYDRIRHWLIVFSPIQGDLYQPIVRLLDGDSLGPPIPQPTQRLLNYNSPRFFTALQAPSEDVIGFSHGTGHLTFFHFDRNTGLLADRLPIDVQRIFYRPYAGDLVITAAGFSPRGKKLYLYTNDTRTYPYRQRFYQFDLQQWDSLAVTRRFYNFQVHDTLVAHFTPASNGQLYFFHHSQLGGNYYTGRLLYPEEDLPNTGMDWFYIPPDAFGPPFLSVSTQSISEAYFQHDARYRFLTDTTCFTDSVSFRMNEIRNLTELRWDMGDGTLYHGLEYDDFKHKYAAPGLYEVHYTGWFCSQEISVHQQVLVVGPPGDVLQDTISCLGAPIAVDARQPMAATFAYRWSDGDTAAVKNIQTAGWWWVEVQGRCGSFTDSFYVHHRPEPLVYVPTDTFYCGNQPPLLQLTGNSVQYRWPDGSNLPFYQPVVGENQVIVQLQNHCGDFYDTIHIHQLQAPDFASLDTVLCVSALFEADFEWDAFTRYLWSDGDDNPSRGIRREVDLTLTLEHPCGNQQIMLRLARQRCDCALQLPTAFSPNGDGLNDVYLPVFDCEPQLFELTVFDRWGKVIFSSTDPLKGWDGSHNGQKQPAGMYAVRLRLLGQHSREEKLAGTAVYLMD